MRRFWRWAERLLGGALSGRGGLAVCPGAPGCAPGCLRRRARGRDVGRGWGSGTLCRGRNRGRPLVPSPGSDGGTGYRGHVLEVCVVAAEVRDLEGW